MVNHGMLETLRPLTDTCSTTSIHAENRRAIVFYDRTTEWKAGGNGKSIVAKSFQHIKPWHLVDMKKEKTGANRFLMSGFTPDEGIVVLSDTTKNLELAILYNPITNGFTVEEKGVDKLVIDEDKAPKLVITTNYTISTTHRSDRRRIWFAPISTYYGEQEDLTGKPMLTSTVDVFATRRSGIPASGLPSIRPASTAWTSTSRTVGQIRGQRHGRTSVAQGLLRRSDAPGRTDQVH